MSTARCARPAARGRSPGPGSETGRPERLAGDLSGCWSRRTDAEHQLVYTLEDDDLFVVQARYHY